MTQGDRGPKGQKGKLENVVEMNSTEVIIVSAFDVL